MAQAASTIEEFMDGLRNAKRVTTVVVTGPNLSKSYITVRNDWFKGCIDRYLGNIYYRYISEVTNDVCSIKPLRFDDPTQY